VTISRIIAALGAATALLLLLIPAPDGVEPRLLHTAAIVVLTISLLLSVALPEYLTALIFFFLCVVLAVAPPEVVFSGFHSGAIWLVFGGMILGVAIEATGLGIRLAGYLERGSRGSYFGAIAGTVVMMVGMAFVMPSSVGRVTITLPIVLAFADRLGFEVGSQGRTGLILAIGMGALIPAFAILPANVPNMVLAGVAEAAHGVRFGYGEYLLLHFPVLGLVSMIALPVFIVFLFPDRIKSNIAPSAATRLTTPEIKLLVVLAVALGLWATDSLHQTSPAWVALGAGIFCSLPAVGIIQPSLVLQKINMGPMLFLAGVIGMGAVVTSSGLGEALGIWLIAAMDLKPGGGFTDFASIIGLGAVLQLFTTLPGQPALMTSFADVLSGATGWPLLTVLMTQVSAWALVMFPYQAPPLVAARMMTGLSVRLFLRLMLPFALFGWVVLVPLQYFWWQFLGYFP
jgi:di/tricarboxylate transporter